MDMRHDQQKPPDGLASIERTRQTDPQIALDRFSLNERAIDSGNASGKRGITARCKGRSPPP